MRTAGLRNRRRRRAPGGRLERPPSVTGGGGFRPGVNARRYSAYCGARISSRCRGNWGSRRGAGLAMARPVPGRGSGGAEEPRGGAPDARDEEHQRLHAKVGELLMENELLYAKVDHLEAGGPLATWRRRRSTR